MCKFVLLMFMQIRESPSRGEGGRQGGWEKEGGQVESGTGAHTHLWPKLTVAVYENVS